MPDRGLTHLDPLGRARMVDVTPKDPTHRRAVARGRVYMHPETTSLVARGGVGKGDVLAVARVAGIQAAKRASDLIPLCHPLLVGAVLVNFRIEDTYIEVESHVDTVDRTGVEMEALTACSVAALTIYDMCKSADRSMTIGDIALWEKTGGRSGVYRREPEAAGLDQSIDRVLLDHARGVDGAGAAATTEPGDGSTGMIGPAGLGDPAEV
jgi:cyclic pyranopterin phosphate synthase